ncbi:MAG: PorT family protein [Dysgonamonadaceae bacterium]|jgi:hypothetical protein|nr:PorT family protein [Dysgonamonadaceae bacterium]
MKKNVTLFSALVAVFLLTATAINAQVRFGIKGEVGANKITLNNQMLEESNYSTYKVGPAIEALIPGINFGVEGALLYSNNQTTVKEWSEQGLSSFGKGEVHYLDIPVNLKYKYFVFSVLGVYVSGGPYAHFKVGGNKFFEEFEDDVKAKNFGTGLNFGLGMELFRVLSVGAGYTVKLSDDYSSQKPEWDEAFNGKKGVWSLTASIYF